MITDLLLKELNKIDTFEEVKTVDALLRDKWGRLEYTIAQELAVMSNSILRIGESINTLKEEIIKIKASIVSIGENKGEKY